MEWKMMLQASKRRQHNQYVNLISTRINSETTTPTTITTTIETTATVAESTVPLSAAASVRDATTCTPTTTTSAWSTFGGSSTYTSQQQQQHHTSCSKTTKNNTQKEHAWSLKQPSTCFFQSTLLWMLLLQLLLSLALPIAVDGAVDTTNGGNLTDLGSPATTLAATHQPLIPYDSQQYFELVNHVTLTELKHSAAHDTSYIFRAKLKVNSVWNSESSQLLEIFITEPTVSAPQKESNKLVQQSISKIPDRPFYISIVNGRPSKVIAHTSRDQSLLNLERGIASLLQISFQNGPAKELDVSGQCSTFYDVKSSTRIEKIKTDCSHWDLRVNYISEKPLGVQQQSEEHISFHLSAEGTLLHVNSEESHSFYLTAKPDVGSAVKSQFSLQHISVGEEQPTQLKFASLDETIKSLLDWYRVFDIEADVDGAISELKHTTLRQQIVAFSERLSNEEIGKETLAVALAELLPFARITKQNEFVEILKAHQTIENQLIDLLGAVQTVDSHAAINAVYSYTEKSHADLLERYLQSLAVGTHPDRGILEDLLQRLKDTENPIQNEKLHDSIVQTLTSLTRQSSFDPNDTLLQQVREYVLENLKSGCKDEDTECQTRYIRALLNLKDSTTLPVLLNYALSRDVKVSVTAMQALQGFSIIYFKEAERKVFTDIFYQRQRKFDSTARVLALEILLSLKPNKSELGQLLDYLRSNDRQFEIKTYVIQKLRMLSEKCPRFRGLLNDCLSERPVVNNYHIIAQKGLTTVLTRQLSQTPSFNESLLSVQEIYQGVLKRGSVEMLLNAGRDETSTFKLGIYTSGLSSFVGDSENDENNNIVDDEEEDDSPATAGMEISVQGVLFRPLVFFSGQTELMGHVWSGTASDPTPAYQATTLAQDHEQYVILSSGTTIYMRLIGMKSVDLNGRVDFSIWNRNANTEIKQNAGSGVVGYAVAGFTYGKIEHQFTIAYEPKISLQADLDFYSGIKLCMQLQRPDMSLTHTNTRTVYLNGDRTYSKSVRSKLIHKSPGQTLVLNQKNNDMCNMIHTE